MSNEVKLGINSKDIVRSLPQWAKIDRTINGVGIYNMNIFDNIMSFNETQHPEVAALDYYGTQIKYGELRALRNAYAKGLMEIGVKKGDVVTLCLPVGIENLMMLFAANVIGAISNNVNFLFLKNDFEYYTLDKHSDIVVTLDAWLPYFVNHLQNSCVKKVVVMNIADYLPEEKKDMFLDTSILPEKMREMFTYERIAHCMMNLDKIHGVEFYPMMQVLEMGKQSRLEVDEGPTDLDRVTTYMYTSGTTGRPKCVVYREYSTNAYIEMQVGMDTQDYVGERVYQVIPMSHMTGERVASYNPLARGGTLVCRPIYDKDGFARDLAETKCHYVMAAASFYMSAVKHGVIAPDALKYLMRPASGGEPITESGVRQVNEWLKANGSDACFSLGGGASEEGGATLVTYFVPEEGRGNKTGLPLEPAVRVKLLDDNGNEITDIETMGNLYATSPAAADSYLNNPEATAARWSIHADGLRWGNTGDIAVRHADGTYNILGRASDSYVDKQGERHFLFLKEYSLDHADPVVEWEITAFEVENGEHHVVGQIVPRKDLGMSKAEFVEYMCKKYELNAIKFYPEFQLGETTGKRDFLLLLHDFDGYLAPCDEEHLYLVTYSAGRMHMKEKILKSDLA